MIHHSNTSIPSMMRRFLKLKPDKNWEVICFMLRLFYGIRCIMAHGNATGTLDTGVLRNFPVCPKCSGSFEPVHSLKGTTNIHDVNTCTKCQTPCSSFVNIFDLSSLLDKCIEQQGRKLILRKNRHFPRLETFESYLPQDHDKERAKAIINGYDIKDIDASAVVNENCAYFHMCRIYHWLEENQRMMYVTYRVLVRINQFILVLAFRMKVAVARMLIEKCKISEVWNVKEEN